MALFYSVYTVMPFTCFTKMREKLVASELFKDRKDSYANSVSVPFVDDRLSGTEPFKSMAKAKQSIVIQQKKYMNGGDEKLIVSIAIHSRCSGDHLFRFMFLWRF